MSRYRFALRPRWILSHLFVAALVANQATYTLAVKPTRTAYEQRAG
jgi:hypothetical protein